MIGLTGLLLGLALASAPSGVDPLAACARPIDDDPAAREGWRCIYMAARRSGTYPQAIELARRHLEHPAAQLTLGSLLSDQGDAEADEHFLSAAEGFAQANQIEGEVYARLNLASALSHKGENAEGEAQLDLAAASAEAAGAEDFLTTVRIQRARLRWWSGRGLGEAWRELRDLYETRFEGLGYQERLVLIHTLARLSEGVERLDEAARWQRTLVELAHENNDAYVEATSRVELARWSMRHPSNRYLVPEGEREAWIEESSRLAENGRNPFAQASAQCLLGELATQATIRDERYTSCLEQLRSLNYPIEVREALQQWALHRSLDDPKAALRLLEEARLAVAEDKGYDMANLKWHEAIVLDRAGEPERALKAARAGLARLELGLQDQHDDLGRVGFLAHWKGLYHEVSTLHSNLGQDAEAWEVMELLRGRVLRDRLSSAAAIPDSTLAEAEINTLAELQGVLLPDEAVIAYQVPPRGAVYRVGTGWLLTRDRLHRWELPHVDDLSQQIELYEGLISDASPDEPRAAKALGQALLAPGLDGLPPSIRALTIIPDGPLNALPFDALILPSDQRLLSRFATSVLPSGSLLVTLRAVEVPDSSAGVFALADPQTPSLDPTTGASLPRLPGARREAQAAVRALGGRRVQDAQATPAALREATETIIHIGAHAIVDATFPERSAVLLAGDEPGAGDLDAAALVELPLEGKIVILSACRSADGPTVAGEGPLGLARALLQAGATTVIGTRWPLPDEAAADFITSMYEHIDRGATVSEAVALARRHHLAAGHTPEVWAGMVVMGDGHRALREPRTSWGWRWLAGGAGATLFGIVALLLLRIGRARDGT